MKKFSSVVLLGLCFLGFFGSALAKPYRMPTNRIIYRVSAEKWVKTDDARVVVGVTAAVKDSDIAKMRSGLMVKLNKISQADWHITRFDRRVDQSGLESVNITATTRIKEDKLVDLRSKAKKVSQPGETYRINNIDFSPSMAAQQKVKDALRAEIYQKVNDELARLKKAYPAQDFTVFRVNFLPTAGYYRGRGNRARKMMSMALTQSTQPSSPLSVSQKAKLNAFVVLAANRAAAKATD